MKLGRLFWKFFFAFWLALVLAGGGVGVAVWWHHQADLEQRQRDRDPALAGGPRAAMSLSHTLGNKFLTVLTNVFFGTTLSDMETCYKCFRR
ncbi:MAG TPA: hypothetical protein PLL39_10310, partial [Rhodocyclaceae bacterium]|nr:hypothetical protein [Rhodocyclaceae bacterium]